MTDQATLQAPSGPALLVVSDTKVLAAYKKMLAYQFGGTLLLAGLTIVGLLICYILGNISPPLLLLVILAGMLGALFSALTRLYQVDQASLALISPTVQALGGGYLMMYSFVPPLIGAIAAVVLYLIFVGGLMSGSLFPTLSCVDGKSCANVIELMQNYVPAGPQDVGKALVWAFAAGFSERLVPDLLQGLVSKEQNAEGK
jgi:hypothetical protein